MNNGTDDPNRPDPDKPPEDTVENPGEEAVESLLRLASSRPEPSEADRRAIRSAVEVEWQAVTSGRRSRRRTLALSVAASIVLAVSLVVLNQNTPTSGPDLQEVALVERIMGRVEALRVAQEENGQTLQQQMPVYASQTIKTAPGSGIALIFESGILLRIDETTEIELVGENSLKLESGRVYVDTHAVHPELSRTNAARFEILTDRGAVRHIGTQYMVLMNQAALSVSVREGNVQVIAEEVDGASTMHVRNGMELTFGNQGGPEITPTDVFGTQWQWAENLAAGFVLDSRTIAEFLEWVARETGHKIRYLSEDARSVATETTLHGTIDLPAREALDLVLMTTDLTATMTNGVIEIRMKN